MPLLESMCLISLVPRLTFQLSVACSTGKAERWKGSLGTRLVPNSLYWLVTLYNDILLQLCYDHNTMHARQRDKLYASLFTGSDHSIVTCIQTYLGVSQEGIKCMNTSLIAISDDRFTFFNPQSLLYYRVCRTGTCIGRCLL